MGGAVALQSAAVEPRIEAVVAESPFANLREVSYDYAGLDISPFLGKTLFRPAVILAMHSVSKEGGFDPRGRVARKGCRRAPISDSADLRNARPSHSLSARGANLQRRARLKATVDRSRAGHAAALGHAPAEYERRVIALFESVTLH